MSRTIPQAYIDAIKALPILDVLEAYGKDEAAIKADKSFHVPKGKNTWKDFNGSGGGDGIAYVMDIVGIRHFIDAVVDIGEKFGLSPDTFSEDADIEYAVRTIPKAREIEYFRFDPSVPGVTIDLEKAMTSYSEFSRNQRHKILYTLFFEFSRPPELLRKRDDYYVKERGLSPDNVFLQRAGYLDKDGLAYVVNSFRGMCMPKEGDSTETIEKKKSLQQDMVDCGLMIEKVGVIKFRHSFERTQDENAGMVLFPSYDIQTTNEVVGFMARLTQPTEYQKEKGLKELMVSIPFVVDENHKRLSPFFPMGADYNTLKRAQRVILTEGSLDGGSIDGLPSDTIPCSSPGTSGISLEMCGIFEGKDVVIAYDQDEAGQKAAFGYVELIGEQDRNYLPKETFLQNEEGLDALEERKKELFSEGYEVDTYYQEGMVGKLKKAGVKSVDVLTWDTSLGGDLNEVRKNGNMSKVYPVPPKQEKVEMGIKR